jgi:IMP dehydrogenase
VIVGNITPEAALFLLKTALMVSVGIGPGSICTHRGGCRFQFSAVPVAAALKGTGVPVIADGGIPHRYS